LGKVYVYELAGREVGIRVEEVKIIVPEVDDLFMFIGQGG
jgi:hypothetical protein